MTRKTVKNNPLDRKEALGFIGSSLPEAKPARAVRQISARIDVALYDRFKAEVERRGMVQQDAVARAIEAWMQGGTSV